MLFAKKKATFLFISNVLGTYIIHNQGISQNYQKHMNNFKLLIKHHIFKIQKFENNKISLWKYFEKKIQTIICLNNFKQNPYSLKILAKLLIIFVKNPIFLIRFSFKKLIKNEN